MKANQRDFWQVATRAREPIRIHFMCGPDEAGAAAAATRLIAALPDAGERVELSGAELKSSPARLVDEARSTSLFGDTRHLVARVSGDDAQMAVETFLDLLDRGEASAAWPVFVLATSATDKSRTAKLLLRRSDALVAMFYPPDMRDFVADIRTLADAAGLRLGGGLAERIAGAANLDIRLARSEIEKLALYLDASPQGPKPADAAAFEAIGAATEEDGFMPLVNAALSGQLRKLPAELRRMREMSLNPVGVALALERRAAQLASLSARHRPGEDMKSFLDGQRVFYRDQRDISEQLTNWSGGKLERLVPRLAALHQNLLANSQMAELLLAHELSRIARFAPRRR